MTERGMGQSRHDSWSAHEHLPLSFMRQKRQNGVVASFIIHSPPADTMHTPRCRCSRPTLRWGRPPPRICPRNHPLTGCVQIVFVVAWSVQIVLVRPIERTVEIVYKFVEQHPNLSLLCGCHHVHLRSCARPRSLTDVGPIPSGHLGFVGALARPRGRVT